MIFKAIIYVLSNMSLNEQINQVVNKAINEYIHRLSTEFSLPEESLLLLWDKHATLQQTQPAPAPKKTKSVQTKLKPSTDDEASHLLKMSKAELVELCRTKNFPVTGSKECLMNRLLGKQEAVSTTKSGSSKASKKTPEKPAIIKSVIKQHVSNIDIKRNKYNRYEHMETKLLFDEATQKVYGKQNYQTGEIERLTSDDIQTCQMYKFPFVMPENLDQANKNTTADDDDEEETVVDDVDAEEEIEVDVECELDDEDMDEELDDIEAEAEVEYEYE